MEQTQEKLSILSDKIQGVYSELGKKIIGQKTLIRDLLIALFSGGHILIEGAPGLAKTLSVESLASALELDFKRIQFTPDLLPSDLVGSNIYNPTTQKFNVKKGPIFSHFVLTDEINRAPSKVQSALLEAMAERQVSIGDKTYKLDEPFMVLATQNPIEQEGTFQLPEAQLDRFLLKTLVDYPSESEELDILRNIGSIETSQIQTILSKQDIFDIQNLVENIYVDENVLQYIKNIVFFTRDTTTQVAKYLLYPLSPRGSISLLKTSKVLAFFEGRDFVLPEDIKQMAYPVLRHRINLSYEALADDMTQDGIIDIILDNVAVS